MRGLAQLAFGVFVVFVIAMFKYGLLIMLLWPVGLLCLMPVAYYVIFERHRETSDTAILERLDSIHRAITDSAPAGRREPSHLSAGPTALLR